MELPQEWCGPEHGIEKFRHWWDKLDGFYSCRWCGEAMTIGDAEDWAKRYDQPVEMPRRGLREGGV